MTVIVVPSHVMSIVELLRGHATVVPASVATDITSLLTLVSDRIDTEWRNTWDKPDGRIYNAITVQTDGGFGPEDIGVRSQGRVLVRCWSTTYHVANQIAQLTQRIISPINHQAHGWTAANTRVDGPSRNGLTEPMQYQDPDKEYGRAMSYIANVHYRRLAVA